MTKEAFNRKIDFCAGIFTKVYKKRLTNVLFSMEHRSGQYRRKMKGNLQSLTYVDIWTWRKFEIINWTETIKNS